ncbi:hypothetical protein [Mucilaginibacter sp. L3T2-6]|uniref:hypothetical protein n=1 Tax=Mucilaginibacter sp. L3T2-6 TaxID=3062491 RepID=UPI002676A9B8|nr:hypothetical protein [Mucilaginibacter sp. L3T2-6]MDO3644934.1 hypothetical protein [Mucilaginibacter sp. L3T2-6]MDV6217385.1 hypothetical protein [Mucilaginibacter sp. L3T2-6]
MKKLIFAAAFMLSCFSIKIANAQISLSINIGSQPDWGPVGYDHADYYYMPDIDAYYDVTDHLYVYNENNVWVHRAFLPERYHFDKYRTYKVVVNERNPWEHDAVIRSRYASYKGRTGQAIIRDSHDARYKNHYREVAEHNRKVAVRNSRVAHHNAQVAKHNRKVAVHNAKTARHIKKKERKEHH